MPNKPHIKMRNGLWFVTTGPEKDARTIACGATPESAYSASLMWQLIFANKSRSEGVRAARSGKFNMNIIITAWRRLRGRSA